MGKIYIGTSGWSYDSWEGTLYPEKLKPKDRLPEYCKTFKTSEINNTFYSLPTKSAVKNWYEETPTDFIFAVKASRFITHNKKLKDPKSSFRKFFTAVDKLEDKLGPILFQLPPRFKYNGERLKEFLKALPKGHRYTFEFRDQTWLNDECYETLEQHKASLCVYDIRQFQSPEVATADFMYLRLHGPEAQAYGGSYNLRTLRKYADKIKKWKKHGDVYVYFDNDQKARAPHDAKRLIDLLKP